MGATQFRGFNFTFKSEAVWILILSIAPLTLGLLIAVLLWLIERVFLF